MLENQKIHNIEVKNLLEEVKKFQAQGYRLVQIGCSEVDGFEITYAFDKNYEFHYIKIKIPSIEIEIPSITSIFYCAFLYENEIKDLFGINITGINIDYKGTFYKTATKIPFNSRLTILIKDIDKETGDNKQQ